MEANKIDSSKTSPVTPKANPPEMNSRQESPLRQIKVDATNSRDTSKDSPIAQKASSAFDKVASGSPKQDSSKSENSAAAMASDWISDVRQQAEGMDQTIQSFVKKSPFAAVAIAVGVGFAGSLLFNKFNSSEKSAKEPS